MAVLLLEGLLRTVGLAQVMFVDVRRDVTSQTSAGVLIESKMYSPVDACVVDIVQRLLERGVFERHSREVGMCQDNRMLPGAVDTPEHLGGSTTSTRVI